MILEILSTGKFFLVIRNELAFSLKLKSSYQHEKMSIFGSEAKTVINIRLLKLEIRKAFSIEKNVTYQ